MQGPKVAPGGKYGERKALQEMQAAAPMAAEQRIPNKVPTQQLPAITPLTAPTSRPQEPLTAGAPFGAGPGPEMLRETPTSKTSDALSQLINFDNTGQIAELYDYLISKGL
jgi:hypothetical protein